MTQHNESEKNETKPGIMLFVSQVFESEIVQIAHFRIAKLQALKSHRQIILDKL